MNISKEYPVYIYVAVGTVAGQLSAAGILAPENYHQYPPFLQNMHNTVPNLRLFIVLFDPAQENPLYMTRDYRLRETQPDKYSSAALQVYVFRQNVHTNINENEGDDSINITDSLRDLNRFALDHRVSLLYHDFSGRYICPLAEYFDEELAPHLDQVVYGLSAREDHGCYFDLTHSNAYFSYRLDTSSPRMRPIIKVFNYYKFIVQSTYNKISDEIALFPLETQHLIREQKNQIIKIIIYRFRQFHIAMLRQLHKDIEIEIQPDFLFMHLHKFQRQMYMSLWNENNHNLLREVIFNFCANQLQIVSDLTEMDISGEDMLRFITIDEDPYKWYNNIDAFLPKVTALA